MFSVVFQSKVGFSTLQYLNKQSCLASCWCLPQLLLVGLSCQYAWAKLCLILQIADISPQSHRKRSTFTESQRHTENMTIIQTFLASALGFWPQHTAPSVLRTVSS